jgi:hypothetical protein
MQLPNIRFYVFHNSTTVKHPCSVLYAECLIIFGYILLCDVYYSLKVICLPVLLETFECKYVSFLTCLQSCKIMINQSYNVLKHVVVRHRSELLQPRCHLRQKPAEVQFTQKNFAIVSPNDDRFPFGIHNRYIS